MEKEIEINTTAYFFARDTSKKIRAVQRAKGERGERVGTTIPYGYMKNPDNPKQLVPNPEIAPIVKRIFEMYSSGIGIRRICATFEREEILCPSVYAFRTTGNRSGNPNLDKPIAGRSRRFARCSPTSFISEIR